MSFRVLHICTGNICRSPMAELLMRHGLEERLDVSGLDAVVLRPTAFMEHHVQVPFLLFGRESAGVPDGVAAAADAETDAQ